MIGALQGNSQKQPVVLDAVKSHHSSMIYVAHQQAVIAYD